jgi:hypothetical protein
VFNSKKITIMKNSLFALAFAVIGFGANASNNLFDVDYAEVTNALTEVAVLEQFVLENEGVSYAEIAENNGVLITNITQGTTITNSLQDGPAGIPSFVWGCLFGILGIAFVYFVEEDSDETKKAFYGCLVGGVSYILLYFLYVGVIVGAAASGI